MFEVGDKVNAYDSHSEESVDVEIIHLTSERHAIVIDEFNSPFQAYFDYDDDRWVLLFG